MIGITAFVLLIHAYMVNCAADTDVMNRFSAKSD
jgi:hypothetical protein